ncbi:MAG: hypothetical protein V3V97_21720 [Hyphomicrobiaceae bacterium]
MYSLFRNFGICLGLSVLVLSIPSKAQAACAMHIAKGFALFDQGIAQQVAKDTLNVSISNWAGGKARVGKVRVSCKLSQGFGLIYECEARAKACK